MPNQGFLAGLDVPPTGPIGSVEVWARETGRFPLVGVDEAGRGPLAGPVVAAAVALPERLPPELAGLDDSKQLKAARRERLAPLIARHALAVGVARVEPARIDTINILEATREAWQSAVRVCLRRLGAEPRALLVDGNLPVPGYRGEQHTLVKGDGRSLNIAAASVIAKTVRDAHMRIWDRHHPGYGFARHKGYGTIAHRQALVRLGPSPIHRASFKWTAPGAGPNGG